MTEPVGMTKREYFAGLAMQNLQNVLLRRSGHAILEKLRIEKWRVGISDENIICRACSGASRRPFESTGAHVKKEESKKPTGKRPEDHWHLCRECAEKKGGVLPNSGMGITVMRGKCPYCGVVATLIPSCDFRWTDAREVFD